MPIALLQQFSILVFPILAVTRCVGTTTSRFPCQHVLLFQRILRMPSWRIKVLPKVHVCIIKELVGKAFGKHCYTENQKLIFKKKVCWQHHKIQINGNEMKCLANKTVNVVLFQPGMSYIYLDHKQKNIPDLNKNGSPLFT